MQIKGELADIIFESYQEETDDIKIIDDGDWIDDGKYSFRTAIVEYENKFYQINQSRSGSYYTDYYYDDPDIYEVTKRVEMVETTFWDIVK